MTAVTASSAAHTALDRQYYNQLAREAAESGLAMAQMCLRSSGNVPSWSASYPLLPDRDCTGMNGNGVSHWMINNSDMRTTFTVAFPTNNTVSQSVRATGIVELLRSSGAVWRAFTYDATMNVGADLDFSTVAFGFVGGSGSYFGAIASDMTLRMAGYNAWGQLGNGTFTDVLTPTRYRLNGSDQPVSVFSTVTTGGYGNRGNVFTLTNGGEIWGAGANEYGQLGNGMTVDTANAVKFQLPVGKTARHAVSGGYSTFVLTTDGNLYSAGKCTKGLLGYNYTISACANQSQYHRVNLPAVTADANTIPTTDIVTGYYTAFVRMQGGKVYGWGANTRSVLAGYSASDTSNPVQIGTFGNAGQPTARQIFTDGTSLWILDSNGVVWGAGYNVDGELAGINVEMINSGSGYCLDNKNQDGYSIWMYACVNSPAQKYTFLSDNSIYNPNTNKCLDNTASDGVHLGLDICDGTNAQKFDYNGTTLKNVGNLKCVTEASDHTLSLATCGLAGQTFKFRDQARLVKLNLPSQAGTVVEIAGTQQSIAMLTSNGQVWGAGINLSGMLGAGSNRVVQPWPVQFVLPNGVVGADVVATCYSPGSQNNWSNVYVIGTNGKVYGAGSNAYGQLGDGTTTNRSLPVAMQVIDGTSIRASQLVAGYGTTVILTTNQKIYVVGNNSDGQLGDGTTTNSSLPKVNRSISTVTATSF